MTTLYVSLALSDTMFPVGNFEKETLTAAEAKAIIAINEHDMICVANPSHASTFDVLERKFGIHLPIPEKAPQVSLVSGDALLVLQARLRRLNEGERHSQETVDGATFSFSLWTIK